MSVLVGIFVVVTIIHIFKSFYMTYKTYKTGVLYESL
jgi:hypothetical protein